MQSEPWFWLGLSPEGTRRHTDRVRSGFYYLALKLDLPVALAYIDYATREVGVSRFVHMSGNVERDLDLIRAFYATRWVGSRRRPAQLRSSRERECGAVRRFPHAPDRLPEGHATGQISRGARAPAPAGA